MCLEEVSDFRLCCRENIITVDPEVKAVSAIEHPGIQQERATVTFEQLSQLGIDFDKDCLGQAIEDLRHYPVLSEGGWFLVIKNQLTLAEIYRRPWHLLGPVELLSHGLNPD